MIAACLRMPASLTSRHLVFCFTLVAVVSISFAVDESIEVVVVPQYDVYKLSLDAVQPHAPPMAVVTSQANKNELNIVAASVHNVRNGSVVGEPFWQFRIAFVILGSHEVNIFDGESREPLGDTLKFNVTPPHDPQGFVHVGSTGRFFTGSDGSTFIPLGLNIAWPGHDVKAYEEFVPYYDSYFKRLSEDGGNLARVWLGPNLVGNKSKKHPKPKLALLKYGFKAIDPVAAHLVDGLLEAAQRYNVRLIMVLESFNALCPNSVSGICKWDTSVYNAKNGGPLKGSLGFLGFWSSKKIIKAWGSYIDYVARRWGAYRSVFAWQLFNEVDGAMYDVLPSAYTWHHTMASRFRASDPYSHLLSESWGLAMGNPVLDHGKLFDFSTTHEYPRTFGDQDLGTAIMGLMSKKVALYDKPALLGEFGCDDTHDGGRLTAEAVHQGVWIPIFAGAGGAGMAWWWDDHMVEDAVRSNIRLLRKFLDLASQRLGHSPGLGGLRWSALSAHDLPKTVVAAGVHGTQVGAGEGGSSAAMVLLRAAAWSRPCEANTSSLAVPAFTLTLPIEGGAAASWRVEWMSTVTGHVAEGRAPTASKGGLDLDVAPFERDIVLLLSRTASQEGAEFGAPIPFLKYV